MSTAAQQRANKENAKHSTGPRTAEGKQRSSQNAIKHGLCALDPLIPGEDPEAFQEHFCEIELELRPASAIESNLVEQIADVSWRLKRLSRIEAAVITAFYDATAEQPLNQGDGTDQLLGKALAARGGSPEGRVASAATTNARRREEGDAIRSVTKQVASRRRNPLGERGLRPPTLSLVGADGPHRHRSSFRAGHP